MVHGCLTLAAGDGHHVTVLLLAIATLLGAARLMGDVAQRYGQPAILGELIAGILLGPTFLGFVWPQGYEFLFISNANARLVLGGLITLSATLLLLVAGLEVDLSVAWKQGKAAILVAGIGMIVPFSIGFTLAYVAPGLFSAADDLPAHWRTAFAVFVGIAVSITSLPIIAKILIDLNIFKADLGMLIMSAAILNDLVGWMGFAVVMALIAPSRGDGAETAAAGSVGVTLLMTLIFIVATLTLGRYAVHRALPFIQVYGSWPGAVIAFVVVVTLLSAALTEYIGIHAIFGAFIAGVAIGDSDHLRESTRETISGFITSIFAPLFFASIGVYINFVTSFDIVTVLIVVSIAFGAKMLGSWLAARLAGVSKRESMAVGFGVAAQGTMGVILGQLALAQNLITSELFVAIIVAGLGTSLVSGPGIQYALARRQQKKLGDLLTEKQWVSELKATDARSAIAEMAAAAAPLCKHTAEEIYEVVWRRERIMHTGLAHGLAVPHARLDKLAGPLIIMGRSPIGIDFDAPDGEPARIICLLLTPESDPAVQLDLLRMVGEAFDVPARREKVLAATKYIEVLAAIKLPAEASPPEKRGEPTSV
jgi:Kef-type K+ transport system membrane component KefB/mannitol/fructose-specific phosphotransferase system IIA component (Ntr-type)